MTGLLFSPPRLNTLSVVGEQDAYPIHRIFCVGRNYAAHAAEMGGQVDREAPWYFTKSAQAFCSSGAEIPYPPGTSNFHYEMELVIALGSAAFEVTNDDAVAAIYGFGCGLDMTRRDRQQDGKDNRRPWSLGKDIENGAVLGPLTKKADFGTVSDQAIWLRVNGEVRQSAKLSDMVWSVSEIVSHLSQFYHLSAGDVIMTGTPAGVGPVSVGDHLTGGIDGLSDISLTISEPKQRH